MDDRVRAALDARKTRVSRFDSVNEALKYRENNIRQNLPTTTSDLDNRYKYIVNSYNKFENKVSKVNRPPFGSKEYHDLQSDKSSADKYINSLRSDLNKYKKYIGADKVNEYITNLDNMQKRYTDIVNRTDNLIYKAANLPYKWEGAITPSDAIADKQKKYQLAQDYLSKYNDKTSYDDVQKDIQQVEMYKAGAKRRGKDTSEYDTAIQMLNKYKNGNDISSNSSVEDLQKRMDKPLATMDSLNLRDKATVAHYLDYDEEATKFVVDYNRGAIFHSEDNVEKYKRYLDAIEHSLHLKNEINSRYNERNEIAYTDENGRKYNYEDFMRTKVAENRIKDISISQDEAKDILKEISSGGRYNALDSKPISKEELNNAGWNITSDESINFTKDYSSERHKTAAVFSPVVKNELGEIEKILSPEELQEYADGVLSGKGDTLGLAVTEIYYGSFAASLAKENSNRISRLSERYYNDTNLNELIASTNNEDEEAKARLEEYGVNWDEYSEYNKLLEDKKINEERTQAYVDWSTKNFGTGLIATGLNTGMGALQFLDYVKNLGDELTGYLKAGTNELSAHLKPNIDDDTLTNLSSESSQAISNAIRTSISKDGDNEFLNSLGTLASQTYGGVTSSMQSALTHLACQAVLPPDLALVVSLGAMAGGAANMSYHDVVNNGGTIGQAVMYSVASGVNEVLGESISLESLLNLKSSLGKSKAKKVLLDILKQSTAEAGEEATTETLNEFADRIINGDKSEYERSVQQYLELGYSEEEAKKKASNEFIARVGWSAYGGFVGGSFSGGSKVLYNTANNAVNNTVNKINHNKQIKETGANINTNNNVSELVETALNLPDTEANAPVKQLAQEIQEYSADKGSKLSSNKFNKQVGKLHEEMRKLNAEQILGADSTVIQSTIKNRLAEVGVTENIDDFTQAIYKQFNNEELTSQEKALVNTTQGQQILEYLNENTDALSEEIANTQVRAYQDLYKIDSLTGENTDLLSDETNIEDYSFSDDNKTYIAGTSQAVDISKIESVSNDDIVVSLSDGSTESVKNLDLSSADDAVMYQGIIDMQKFIGVSLDTKAANSLMLAYRTNGGDAATFVTNAKIALANGYANVKLNENLNISPEIARSIYDLGRNIRVASDNVREARVKKKTVPKTSSVTFDGVDESTLNDRQKVSVEVMKKLSEATGINVVFYRSELKNGKWTSKYEGKKGLSNGFYESETNTVYLDVNSGLSGSGKVLFAAAHELVHVIRTWSPKSFTTFANFLMEKYAEKGESVDKLIRDKMNKLGLSYDMAYEEVVADSCESFLVDSNIVQRIQELAQKDKSLVQKIKSYLKNLLNAIKKAYDKLVPESEEGRIVREMRDSIDELHNKFYEALKSASDNIHNSEVSTTKNTANNDGVKYMIRNTEDGKSYVMADRQVIKGDDASKWGGQVTNYINDHIRKGENVVVYAKDGDALTITRDTAGKARFRNYTYQNGKRRLMTDEEYATKLRAETHIDELSKVSKRGNKIIPDKKKHTFAKDGFNYRTAYFMDIDGSYYRLTISVGKNGIINTVYNVGKIKEVEHPDVAQRPKPHSFSAEDEFISTSNKRIPQDNSSVNNQSMQKDRKNSLRDTAYLEAVNNGDMETAQRMVDEYAEEIFSNSKIRDEDGRLLKVYHGTDADFTVFDKTKGRSSMDIQGMFFSPWDIDAKGYGPNVRAFYLNITNPANESTGYRYLRKYRGQYYAGTKAREELESIGYDGVNNENEEFIAFNSEQIKSADPVTYDDNGDVIPLSKRFDVENEDIRYQARPDFDDFIFEDFDGEVTDNDARLMTEYLRQGKTDIVSHLINQTRNIEMADGKIRSLVNRLIKSYDLSTTSNKDIQLAVMSLLESTNKTEVEENLDLLQGVLSKVVRESNYISEADREFKAEVNEFLKDYRKEYNVYLNDEQLSSLEFQGRSVGWLRNKLSGIVNIVKEDSDTKLKKTSFGYFMHTMAEVFPESFSMDDIDAVDSWETFIDKMDKINNPTDMGLENIYGLSESEFVSEVSARMIADIIENKYNSRKNTYVETLVKKLRREHNERVRKERIKVRQKVKEAEEKKYDKLVEKHKEQRKAYTENRNKTAIKNKIRNTIKQIDSYLNKGNKKKNVKEGMRDFASKALELADIIFENNITNEDIVNRGVIGLSEREQKYFDLYQKQLQLRTIKEERYNKIRETASFNTLNSIRGEIQKIDNKLKHYDQQLKDVFSREKAKLYETPVNDAINALADAYSELQGSEHSYISNAFDENVLQMITDLKETIGKGTRVKDMTISQLSEIHKSVTAVLTTIRNANKLFGINSTISETSEKSLQEFDKIRDTKETQSLLNNIFSDYGYNSLKPIYMMRLLGSKTFENLFWNLQKGEIKWYQNLEKVKEFRDNIAKRYNYKSWDFKNQTTFIDAHGNEFALNLEQMLSMYALSRRPQGREHLLRDGFVNDEIKINGSYKKGYKVSYKNGGVAHSVDVDTLAKISGTLTDEQRSYVKEMQNFLSNDMAELGNEVSMKIYGVKLFEEAVYFPIKVAKDFLPTDYSTSNADAVQKNKGFTHKTVKNAGQPLVLGEFSTTWANHCDDMAQYNALVLPLEDITKVMNYRTSSLMSGGPANSVKQQISGKWGKSALNYIETLIRDINGGVRTNNISFGDKLISLSKKASVFASVSVVIQQPFAVARAMAIVNPKYFAKSSLKSFNFAKHNKDWSELKKYAPVAGIKEMGYFDTGVGQKTSDWILQDEYNGLKEKSLALFKDSNYRDEVLSKAPAVADELAWVSLWHAVKAEIKDTTDLTGEAYYERCGERFNEVVQLTQVYDSVFSRSGFMRNKEPYAKMATAFMAEPTVTLNMSVDALVQGKRIGGLKGAKYSVKVLSAVLASQVLTALAKSAWTAGRDDDEDKTYGEKYLETAIKELKSNLNPLNQMVLARDIVSLIEGHDVNRMDLSLIDKLIKEIKILSVAISDENKDVTSKMALNVIGAFSDIFGIPVRNIVRDINTGLNLLGVKGGKDENSVKYANNLYMDGDTKAFKSSVDAMIQTKYEEHYAKGELEEDARKNARKDIKSAFTREYKELYLECFYGGKTQEAAKIRQMLYSTGLYGTLAEFDKDIAKWKKDYNEQIEKDKRAQERSK